MTLFETEMWLSNVGTEKDISIKELEFKIQEIIGHDSNIRFKSTYTDGTMRKVMDSSRIFGMGWKPKYSLEEGIKKTYSYYK